MLCSLAKTRRDEAMTLFEIFKLKDKLGMSPGDLEEILGALEARFDRDEDLEVQNAISYADFMDAVKRGGFKSTFEDIMFSTRVMIDNRDDFLEFLQNLIKNGFIEMGLNYIESAAAMFAGDERGMFGFWSAGADANIALGNTTHLVSVTREQSDEYRENTDFKTSQVYYHGTLTFWNFCI